MAARKTARPKKDRSKRVALRLPASQLRSVQERVARSGRTPTSIVSNLLASLGARPPSGILADSAAPPPPPSGPPYSWDWGDWTLLAVGFFLVVEGSADPIALAEWLAREFQLMKQEREPQSSDYIPSAAGRRLVACMDQCANAGQKVGSKEYWDCVRTCLAKKKSGR